MGKSHQKTKYISKVVMSIGILMLISIIYYVINPETLGIFPKCIFYQLTGLQCPSCGNQRAFHAFLHGNIEIALHYNLFIIVALPYAAMIIFTLLFSNKITKLWRNRLLSKWIIIIYMCIYLTWGIVRNL